MDAATVLLAVLLLIGGIGGPLWILVLSAFLQTRRQSAAVQEPSLGGVVAGVPGSGTIASGIPEGYLKELQKFNEPWMVEDAIASLIEEHGRTGDWSTAMSNLRQQGVI